jgi:hypothetical protein
MGRSFKKNLSWSAIVEDADASSTHSENLSSEADSSAVVEKICPLQDPSMDVDTDEDMDSDYEDSDDESDVEESTPFETDTGLTRKDILAAIAHRRNGGKGKKPLCVQKPAVSKEEEGEQDHKVVKASVVKSSKKESHTLDQLLDKSANKKNKVEEYGPKKFIKP